MKKVWLLGLLWGSASKSAPEIPVGLSKEQINHVFMNHRSEIRTCYDTALKRNPKILGKVDLSFVIGADGLVTQVRVKQSSTKDPELDRCLVTRLRTWQFPVVSHAETVVDVYPITFEPAKK